MANSLENFWHRELICGKFSREFIAYKPFTACYSSFSALLPSPLGEGLGGAASVVSLLSVLTVFKITANADAQGVLSV